MLFNEPVIDAPAGVALLSRLKFIICQLLVYDGNEPAEYWSGTRLAQAVPGRTGISDSRPDCTPVMVPLPGNLPYTLAFNEEGPSDLLFLVHFKHPFPPVTGFLSSIPDSTGPVGVFSPITDSRRWVLIILALT